MEKRAEAQVNAQPDVLNYDVFRSEMLAAINPPEVKHGVRGKAGMMLGIVSLAGIGGLASGALEMPNATPTEISVGNIDTNSHLVNSTSAVNLDSAKLVVSAPADVTGPGGSGSCGPLDKAAAAERHNQNPEAPVQSKSDLLSFMRANPDRANKIDTAMEEDEGALLNKIIPEGQHNDALAYFDNMEIRRLDNDVTVNNTFCDAQGNVIKWRTEKLAAGTDVFTFVVKDGVFTRKDGKAVKLTEADMADSIVVNQNGETLLLELKNPCNNELNKIAPSQEVATTKPEVATTKPEVTTTTKPEVTTTKPEVTTTTKPEVTTTTKPEVTTTTKPEVTTTTKPEVTTTTKPEVTTTTKPEVTTTTKPEVTTTTKPEVTTTTESKHPKPPVDGGPNTTQGEPTPGPSTPTTKINNSPAPTESPQPTSPATTGERPPVTEAPIPAPTVVPTTAPEGPSHIDPSNIAMISPNAANQGDSAGLLIPGLAATGLAAIISERVLRSRRNAYGTGKSNKVEV